MDNFDDTDLHKSYAWAHVKVNETVTITIRSHQIGRKLQSCTKKYSPPDFNIVPTKYPSITSVLSQ